MKLLFCPNCDDVFKLDYDLRACKCGLVKGKYLDLDKAVVNGKGVSFAISNHDWYTAEKMTKIGQNYDLECWARPHEGTRNPNTKVDKNL